MNISVILNMEGSWRLICGIDEVARGPVVGPLIIVGYMIKESDLDKLKATGVKDSKLLTHKQREKMVDKLKELAEDYKVIVIQPKEIDEAVESTNHMNLNWLEAKKQAEIINELDPDVAYIDCPSPNIRKYKDYLFNLINNDKIELIVEHKADVKYPVVSAASVIAKCIREDRVKMIEEMTGQSIGSGYPSNPICQKFLKENIDKYPDVFRKSWMTFKNYNAMKKQKKLDEF